MGSLPNLSELCRERAQRRIMEKLNEDVRERYRERDFSRGDKEKGERLPNFPQVRTFLLLSINSRKFPAKCFSCY